MRLVLRGLRVELQPFVLEVDVELTREVTGLFGPSGAGKTTILEVVAGLRRAERAFVELDGRLLVDSAAGVFVPARARRIGYVPQDGALFPHLSVRANLLYGQRRGEPRDPRLTLGHLIDVLDLGELLERGISGLSGGERQRVALARALLSAPRLLLLDEPLASLDAERKGRILDYLQRVRRELGVPMIYVAHDAEEVLALCDEVLLLARGRVTASGDPRGLLLPPALAGGQRLAPRLGAPEVG